MIMLNDAQPTKLLSHTEAQKMFVFLKVCLPGAQSVDKHNPDYEYFLFSILS